MYLRGDRSIELYNINGGFLSDIIHAADYWPCVGGLSAMDAISDRGQDDNVDAQRP